MTTTVLAMLVISASGKITCSTRMKRMKKREIAQLLLGYVAEFGNDHSDCHQTVENDAAKAEVYGGPHRVIGVGTLYELQLRKEKQGQCSTDNSGQAAGKPDPSALWNADGNRDPVPKQQKDIELVAQKHAKMRDQIHDVRNAVEHVNCHGGDAVKEYCKLGHDKKHIKDRIAVALLGDADEGIPLADIVDADVNEDDQTCNLCLGILKNKHGCLLLPIVVQGSSFI